jgi:hypothetical protein
MCISDDAIEKSVTSPARTHTVRGTRVFTGILPIVIMAISLRRPTPCVNNVRRGSAFLLQWIGALRLASALLA